MGERLIGTAIASLLLAMLAAVGTCQESNEASEQGKYDYDVLASALNHRSVLRHAYLGDKAAANEHIVMLNDLASMWLKRMEETRFGTTGFSALKAASEVKVADVPPDVQRELIAIKRRVLCCYELRVLAGGHNVDTVWQQMEPILDDLLNNVERRNPKGMDKRILPERICANAIIDAVQGNKYSNAFPHAIQFVADTDFVRCFPEDELFMVVYCQAIPRWLKRITWAKVEPASKNNRGPATEDVGRIHFEIDYDILIDGPPAEEDLRKKINSLRENAFAPLARIKANVWRLRQHQFPISPVNELEIAGYSEIQGYFSRNDINVNRDPIIDKWEVDRLYDRYYRDLPFGDQDYTFSQLDQTRFRYVSPSMPKPAFGEWSRTVK